jgi:hypothetical protein
VNFSSLAHEIGNEMCKSRIKVQREDYYENPSKTEKQSNCTNFWSRKRPGDDKIEYDAAYGLYKKKEKQ